MLVLSNAGCKGHGYIKNPQNNWYFHCDFIERKVEVIF